MDRRLILSVAGSGKTTFLINKLDLENRFLIVTYTNNNILNIKRRIIDRFGFMPNNITLVSYFQFLIRICYRPFLKYTYRAKGISWIEPEDWTRYEKSKIHYMTSSGYIYHNRLAKLCLHECSDEIRSRIEKFYDCLLFDEVQDLGGYDFGLVQAIVPSKIDCLFVGDYYQHTYDTSKDGNMHSGLYKNYKKYKLIWRKLGLEVDENTLSNSYRCSPSVCEFVCNNLGIKILSHRHDMTNIIFIDKQNEADELFKDSAKIKLFYKESNKYNCYAENWGRSKGLDCFEDVCVVLNKTVLSAYRQGALNKLPDPTRNRLYVACTRAKGNLFFIPHYLIDKYKQ